MTPAASPTRLRGYPAPSASLFAAFAALYVFWGGTFLAIRYAVYEIPPLLMMATRCAAGAAILVAWLAARRQLERPTPAQWLTSAMAGAFLFVGCHGLMAWAEQRVTSGQTALYATAIPLWIVLLDALPARRRPAARVLAGLALGTLGVAILTGGDASSGTVVDRIVLIIGGLYWAAGSLVARDGARPRSAFQSTAMQLAAGAAALLVASALTGELSSGWTPAKVTARGVASLAFLVVCGTVLGFGAYTWLMRVAAPATVSTYAFVNPIVALALGWAVGDDLITWRTAVAAALVIGAVLLTRSPPAAATLSAISHPLSATGTPALRAVHAVTTARGHKEPPNAPQPGAKRRAV
jgi:drug/metabolite transporter (DMT)-like permease